MLTSFTDSTAASGIDYTNGFVGEINFDTQIAPNGDRFVESGAASGDYDGDGFDDIFVVRGNVGPNLLYRNLGNGQLSFIDEAASAGLAYTKSINENYRHTGPMFSDMDGDGDLDLFLGGIMGDPTMIFRNNLVETGTADFTDVTSTSGLTGMQAKFSVGSAFGDYDLDGDLDLFVAHWGTPRDSANPGDTESLWRNESLAGVIKFTNVSVSSRISATLIGEGEKADFTFAPSFAHVDNDAFPDLVVTGDFHTSRVFMNNGNGTFRDATDHTVIVDQFGMGSALGDYDGDGDLDWFVSSAHTSAPDFPADFHVGNRLYRNVNGRFEDATDDARVRSGGWGWGACFVDFENDADLDIYHTNGWHAYPEHGFLSDTSRAFVSDGAANPRFNDSASALGLADTKEGRGVVCADFDKDGDVDIFQLHRDEVRSATMWRNDAISYNWLRVRLVGLPPNTEAAGARIRVRTYTGEQMREVMIGSNFNGQNPVTQVFGLGLATSVDRVTVEWPGAGGKTTVLTSIAAQQSLTISHPDL